MRQKIFSIISPTESNSSKLSNLYDSVMIAVIIISLIPLAFKETTPVLQCINSITVAVFILDYFLRLITAEIVQVNQSLKSIARIQAS